VADEDRAGVADVGDPVLGVVQRQLEVLGRDAVGERAGLLQAVDVDQRAAVGERPWRSCRGAAWWAAGGRSLVHRVDEAGVGAQQDGLRELVVLGLGEEVHRHPVGVAGAIGDDQHFGGPGDHVDADGAEHAALGLGHIGVARADDLVHLRDGLRAVGQRRHRLRAADGEHAVDAGDRRAASTSGFFSPRGVGTTMISSPTPATLAGIAFISTELG
jgi:hypothetical protein